MSDITKSSMMVVPRLSITPTQLKRSNTNAGAFYNRRHMSIVKALALSNRDDILQNPPMTTATSINRHGMGINGGLRVTKEEPAE